ncbi:acyltransferase family protein [Spiroplasma tabanidicola]|uniref:Acyltransferase 3 domain-containing protein n=1 Tax=Spiroplasma tabanidicola TaxID=324079 RepID=A0A6I6CJX1_9MOLU|nr:acyltransferase family protein [Spiroplasma tabanidicola]QGS52393.1 hypothetical protein STABA_v1c10450 [Spiroplasma tabanidicola]
MKNRVSSIELLRLFLAFFVIANHVWGENDSAPNLYFFTYLFPINMTHISTFAFITGFFLANKGKPKKLFKYVTTLIFYFAFNFIVSFFVEYFYYDVTSLSTIYNFTIEAWWYAFSIIFVFALYIFFSDKMAKLDWKVFLLILIILLITLSVFNNYTGWQATWLILVALFGSFSRLHLVNLMNKKWFLIVSILVLVITTIAMDVILSLGKIEDDELLKTSLFFKENNPLAFVLPLFIFTIFYNIKIKSKFINYISSFTLGIYLCMTIYNHLLYSLLSTYLIKLNDVELNFALIGLTLLIFITALVQTLIIEHLKKGIFIICDKNYWIKKKILIKEKEKLKKLSKH